MLRMGSVLPAALGVLLVSIAGVAPAGAAPVRYGLSQHGQPVGSAVCHVEEHNGGSTATALVRLTMDGLRYTLSTEVERDAQQQLNAATLSGTVNDDAVQMNLTNQPPTLTVQVRAGSGSTTNTLDGHARLVLLADFDPCALEQLLALEAAGGSRDLWAFVPHQNGSVEAVQISTLRDEAGVLDGKPVVVHHLQLTVAGASTELFTDEGGHLLQAELPQPGFAAVRESFTLTPPQKPAPPAGN